MAEKWEDDYDKYRGEYQKLQKEIEDVVLNISDKYATTIDIAHISQRPQNKVKTKHSILNNFNNSTKYKKIKTLLDIKDIAGVRAICHCEDDVESFSTIVEGELRQNYLRVSSQEIGGKGSEYPYHARHIILGKKINSHNKPVIIFCEIQIKTVMADAWAIQNHKYLYKKAIEGEAHELTNAVSEIMNGCEKLWSLVKKKSLENGEKKGSGQITSQFESIQEKTEKKLGLIKTMKDGVTFRKNWFTGHASKAKRGLSDLGIKAYMEVKIELLPLDLSIDKTKLKDTARVSTVDTFGWPIAVFLDREEFKPKVDSDGIYAEISIKESAFDGSSTYDYWAIHTNGAFYLLQSLFEDTRKPNVIFFDTRIIRITEVLMYISNLYSSLEIPINDEIVITITHGEIGGRALVAASTNRLMFHTRKASTSEPVSTTVKTTLDEISTNPVEIVEKFTKPLFEHFDFFQLDKQILTDIVTNYLNGKIV